jgi:hypothetical protein
VLRDTLRTYVPSLGQHLGQQVQEGNGRTTTTAQQATARPRKMTPVRTDIPDFTAYEADFRHHHRTHLAHTGISYEHFIPAYRYGYNLARNARVQGRDWATIEPEARRFWEDRNPGTWEQFKESVHYAWDRVHEDEGIATGRQSSVVGP